VLHACRDLGGAKTTTLAHKLDTTFAATDLIVPFATRAELTMFETAARHGHALFGPRTPGGDIRGANGFIALFTGRPGTGKTMGAQIVARSLDVDLLRIDLSQVVDKYIGETEKRLDAVFREAEASGAMLFFDEADALFGKRTEVKDAHDRYSNIETAFLLQRLEQHPGVAILATNLANNLDTAFLRRIHFVIEFPLPGPAERAAIWERHVQKSALDDDVDLVFLSEFELSGGDIRNAAVAAVLLAHGGQRIAMRHLVLATSRELRKAGRLTQPDQFGPWREAVMAHLRGTAEARLST
jgi:SpoVK/Ycf46/Vps4 family AAA+-type ATPase